MYQKRIQILVLFILLTWLSNLKTSGQILTAPNAHTSVPTNYSNYPGEDSIYIFCLPQQSIDEIDVELKAIAPFANPPYTFIWYKYDPDSYKYTAVKSDSLTLMDTSFKTIDKKGLYAVEITRVSTDTIFKNFQKAWVFLNEPEIRIDTIDPSKIEPFNLKGYFNADDTTSRPFNFEYFDPDTSKFLISESTEIEICFTLDHDTLSQLGFYLEPPGSDTLLELLPAISNWHEITDLDSTILGCIDFNQDCDTGINAVDFCFSTSAIQVPCVCEMNFPLSGQYAPAGDWSVLYGENPALNEWEVKFFDCNQNNEGILKNISLTFTDTINDEAITYHHKLENGALEIETSYTCNSLIDLFEYTIPAYRNDTITLENPFTFVWWADPFINIPDSIISFKPLISPYPVFITRFTFTVTDTFGCVFIDTLVFEPAESKLEMPKYFLAPDEEFKPKEAALLRQYNIRIYNRYGQLVFETDDPTDGWDGTNKDKGNINLPSGYYFYILQAVGWDNFYKYLDSSPKANQGESTSGKPDAKKPVIQKGTVYLYRKQ